MTITADTVRHVARLARLEVSPEEITTYSGQLSRILNLMEQLKGIPTAGVAPMSHAVAMILPEREDAAVNGDARDVMLANAPDSAEGCFRVPKIIE